MADPPIPPPPPPAAGYLLARFYKYCIDAVGSFSARFHASRILSPVLRGFIFITHGNCPLMNSNFSFQISPFPRLGKIRRFSLIISIDSFPPRGKYNRFRDHRSSFFSFKIRRLTFLDGVERLKTREALPSAADPRVVQ